jgi:hypothetical protein
MEGDGSWMTKPRDIRSALRESASRFVSYAVALQVALDLRRRFGNIDVMPSAAHDKTVSELQALFRKRIEGERERFEEHLDPELSDEMIDSRYRVLRESIETDTDAWKELIPGKPVLNGFAAKTKLSPGRLKTLYIAAAAALQPSPFDDILSIFARLASSEA